MPGKGFIGVVLFILFVSTSIALAERDISADAYRDRLGGMWLGQLLGNYAGRQVEGKTTVLFEGPDAVNKPITEYQVQWNTILQGQYYVKNTKNLAGDTSYWQGDDDTCLEFLYAHSLQSQASLNVAERTSVWDDNLAVSGLYIANQQAWNQINTYSRDAVASGSLQRNMYAGWAIDAQITTESLGAVSPGMRQQASNLAGDFGGITNTGYSLHAAQFYAAMYADAPFTSDVETLVHRGLEVVPTGSWTRDIVAKAQQLYDADKADGSLDNWLASRDAIVAFAGQQGRYQSWVESSSNTGLTTLAILYGQGNFKDTVEYGVRGGMDSDCNPATAAGLVGMMKGQAAVLTELQAAGLTTTALPQQYYSSATVTNLPKSLWSMDEVMDIMQAAAETQLLAGGGSILDPGGNKQYVLSAADTGLDAVVTSDVSDPTGGPRGVVGQVLAEGGTVDVVVTRNGTVITDNATKDRTNQGRLIDGVIDLSNNGVLPFDTYVSTMTDPRTDGYELHFDREVLFQKLLLHEGDIRAKVNTDPGATEPYGGYFLSETLVVEVLQDGVWVEASNLAFSEAFEALKFFQSIELTFDGIQGEAIRVVGSAGGTIPYTSFTEIEAFGVVPEPTTLILCAAGAAMTLLRRRRNPSR